MGDNIEKTELGDLYTFPEGAVEIAFTDNTTEAYSVDRSAIYAETGGTFLFATASGCSCWDGDWYAVRYNSVEDLLTDIGPEGTADYEFHPNFTAQENLRAQVEEWKSK